MSQASKGSYGFAIFDCDGVIFDSNDVKTKAFAESLQHHPKEAVDKFMKFHKARGGISRFEKFTWFYRDYLCDHDWEAAADAAAQRFAALVKQDLMAAPEVPGVVAALKYLREKGTRCYVISGGEEKEVQWLLGARDLARFFDAILGSPASKLQHVRTVKANHPPDAKGVLFGDARTDLEAAEAYGLDFVFVRGFTTWTDCAEVLRTRRHPIVRDLDEWLMTAP